MMAKCRLDIIDGNAAGSNSCVLNCSARMESIREANELAAAVAEISKDKDDEKKRKKDSVTQKALDKAAKQKAAEDVAKGRVDAVDESCDGKV